MANDWPRCAPATSNGSISSPSMRHSPRDGGAGVRRAAAEPVVRRSSLQLGSSWPLSGLECAIKSAFIHHS